MKKNTFLSWAESPGLRALQGAPAAPEPWQPAPSCISTKVFLFPGIPCTHTGPHSPPRTCHLNREPFPGRSMRVLAWPAIPAPLPHAPHSPSWWCCSAERWGCGVWDTGALCRAVLGRLGGRDSSWGSSTDCLPHQLFCGCRGCSEVACLLSSGTRTVCVLHYIQPMAFH